MSEHAELIERLEYAENYTMDCGRCGGCGELDAGGAPCPGCDGRGYLTAKTLCFEAADALSSSQAEIERLREALEFYADPENYHAIAFLGDAPCGDFAADFDEDHGHPDYDRGMPGRRARSALSVAMPMTSITGLDQQAGFAEELPDEAAEAFARAVARSALSGQPGESAEY